MKKCLLFVFACVLALGLTSCEADDQYSVESTIIGRSWTGDVGMNAGSGESLFSTFYFGSDGFGEEYQYYQSDGALYKKYNFMWRWEDGYHNNLILDYGKEGISYMDDLSVLGDELHGIFVLSYGDPGFPFVLRME